MYRIVNLLARAFAIMGGTVLTGLIILTCISILGRSLNTVLHSEAVQGLVPGFAEWALARGIGPINGDFEIVEAGMAFAIFAFLPICQLQSAHASVDVVTARLPVRINRALRAVAEIIFAAVLVLIAVQLWSGTLSKLASGQTTFLLEFPVWWAYALSLVAALVAAVTALYVAAMRVLEWWSGRPVLPPDGEAEH